MSARAHTCWAATSLDVPWMLEVAAAAYPPGTFEPADARPWLLSLIADPSCLALRGARAFLIVRAVSIPYNRKRIVAWLLPMASLGNGSSELLAMTRLAMAWAKAKGACEFKFAAMDEYDLGPIARRIGGRPIAPSYTVNL